MSKSTTTTTAVYTQLDTTATSAVVTAINAEKRRSSSSRSSLTLTTSNNPVRRRSSALVIPPSLLSTATSSPEYTKVASSSLDPTTDRDVVDFSGIFHDSSNEDENPRHHKRHSFTAKPRPVSFGDYCHVLYKYPNYRYYLLSHICQHTGDWFVRIASILIVEELAPAGEKGEALAYMALATKFPQAVSAPIGGVLADQFDRRTLMIVMDVLSGIVVLGFLVAIQWQSLSVFYLVTAFRAALGASYFPATTGIVPLMVSDARDLQLAVTMNSWAWGTMAIVGGMVAGTLAAAIGLRTCYYIDFVTFLLSAVVIKCGVHGNFRVKGGQSNATTTTTHAVDLELTTPQSAGASTTEANDNPAVLHGHPQDRSMLSYVTQPCKEIFAVIRELMTYLRTCEFGMMVLLKSSASFVWGIEDIVGAEFSTVYEEDGTENEELSSIHMGMLFSVVGLGCMVGPAIVNMVTDAHRPYTLQRACLMGVSFLTGGWLAISLTHNFPQFLAGTFFRTMGSGTVWVYSTLVLQTLTDKEILGRVLAVEYTMTQLFEAASASATGRLDEAGLTKNQLALFGCSLGVVMLTFWGTYYSFSLGAANPKFNNNYNFDVTSKVTEGTASDDDQEEIEMGTVTMDSSNSKTESRAAFV